MSRNDSEASFVARLGEFPSGTIRLTAGWKEDDSGHCGLVQTTSVEDWKHDVVAQRFQAGCFCGWRGEVGEDETTAHMEVQEHLLNVRSAGEVGMGASPSPDNPVGAVEFLQSIYKDEDPDA